MSDLVTNFHLLRPLWLLTLPVVVALVWLYRRGRWEMVSTLRVSSRSSVS
jgi:hypothetical protein